MLLLLTGCPPKTPQGVHVQVSEDQLDLRPEGDRMREVLDGAAPDAQACYLDELERDPRAYGDLVFVVTVAEDGAVSSVELSLSTLSATMDACIVEVVQALDFPPPSAPDTTLRYPMVFTTEITPPEVTRALMLKHGLLDLEEEAQAAEDAALDPKKREEQGERGWTESW